jgi:hypothetical protein
VLVPEPKNVHAAFSDTLGTLPDGVEVPISAVDLKPSAVDTFKVRAWKLAKRVEKHQPQFPVTFI